MKRNDLLYTWWDQLGNVPEDNFYLGSWCETYTFERLDIHTCDTTACAAGWLPTFFPNEWRLIYGTPRLTHTPDACAVSSVSGFFGVSEHAAELIVWPCEYSDGSETPLSTVRERILAYID